MAKKTFKGGIDSLLGDNTTKQTTRKKETRGRPRTNFKKVERSAEDGTKEGETRYTVLIKIDTLEKLKAIAYMSGTAEGRKTIKDVVAEMSEQYVDRFEKKHGIIKIKKSKR